jgi:hypothetical protein
MDNYPTTKVEKGFWWLPDDPDNKLSGTITYGPQSGMELDLVGSLRGGENPARPSSSFVVWGETVRSVPITLFHAFETNIHTHRPGLPTSKIETYQGVVGGHYRNLDDVRIHTLEIDFDYLTAWAGQTGLIQTFDEKTKNSQITIEPPPKINLGKADDVQVDIVPVISQSHSSGEIVLREHSEFQLRTDSPKPYSHFESVAAKLRTFLTFAAGESAYPIRVKGLTDTKDTEIDGNPIWQEIEIIREINLPAAKREIRPERMIFTLEDLRTESGPTLEKFLIAEQRLRLVFQSFFLPYFFSNIPIPLQFLNHVHTLEALHRTTIGGKYESGAEFQKFLKKITASIPENLTAEFRSSLEARLNNLDRFSFRKRLRDVVHKFEELVTPFISDVSAFIDRVTLARNSLLYGPTDRPGPDFAELWKLSQLLGLILEIGLLSEIGFSIARMKVIISRGKRAQLVRANVF